MLATGGMVAATASAAPNDINAAAQNGATLLEEGFTGASVSEGWKFLGDACLTAASSGERACAKTEGTDGYTGEQPGFLQLTDVADGRTGTVLYNSAVQSRLGLDISFYQYQFDGTKPPADGIGFFLTDGSYTLDEPGPTGQGVGGALGYSAIADSNNGNRTVAGIPNGVLGIGLDTFGNFSAKSQVGGDDKRDNSRNESADNHRYSVTVRGKGAQNAAGEWKNGYGIIARESNDTIEDLLHTKKGPEANESGQNGGTLVNVKLGVPNASGIQHLTVTLTGANKKTVTVINMDLKEALPDTIKFGFTAATGDNNAAHFIRGVTAKTVEPPTSAILLTKTVNHNDVGGTDKQLFQAGDSVPYLFEVQNVGDKKLTDITVTDEKITAHGGTVNCSLSELGAGEKMTCTGSLTLTDDDVAENGTFENTATVTGRDTEGKTVTDTSTATIETFMETGAPAHRKYITKDDVSTANPKDSYTLHLDVTGNSSSSTTGEKAKVDVVYVLDKSTSMGGCVGSDSDKTSCWQGTSRLMAMRTAAKSLTDTIFNAVEKDELDARVGIVSFSGSATKINFGSRNQPEYYSSSAQDVKDAIDNKVTMPSWGDGTSWYAGLSAVASNTYTPREDAKKFIVFLTDGQPNQDTRRHNQQGATLAKDGWNILNVLVDDTNAKTQFDSLTVAEKNAAGTGQIVEQYTTKSQSDLNKVFENISQIITNTTTYQVTKITDNLSEYADPVDWEAGVSGSVTDHVTITASDGSTVPEYTATYDAGSRKVTVTFTNFQPKKDVTYTVSFKVRPSQKAYEQYAEQGYPKDEANQPIEGDANTGDTSAGKVGFPSNDSAQLTYQTVLNGEPGQEKTADYPKPVLQVKTGKIHVTKTWNPLVPDGVESVSVGLYRDGSAQPAETKTITPDDKGKWSADFENLVPGNYTVKEDPVSDYESTVQYEDDAEKKSVSITTDDLWQASADTEISDNVKTYQVSITNTLQVLAAYSPFEITKELKGAKLEEKQFDFHVKAADSESAGKAGFPAVNAEGQVLTDCEDTDNDGMTDSCWFKNQNGTDQAGARAVARDANTLKFTAADANAENGKGSTFTYLYTEPKDASHNENLSSVYVLDSHTYKAEVKVAWADSDKKDALKITTTVYRGVAGEDGNIVYEEDPVSSSEWFSADSSKSQPKAVVPFVNKFSPVEKLPLTGGTTDRQWLVTGLVLGGLALLLAGATGLWRDCRRMF